MIPFWGKKEEKQNSATIVISADRKDKFFLWSWNYKENSLNKGIKTESFEKDLMNLIDTNTQINMTSNHSVSSDDLFKSHLNP